MPIDRSEKSNNYTIFDNFILSDIRLSFKAKGIWFYAFSHREDCEINVSELASHSLDDVESIESALLELEEFGYLQNNGKAWILSEIPLSYKSKV